MTRVLSPETQLALKDLPPFLREDPDIQGTVQALVAEVKRLDDAKENMRTNFFPSQGGDYLFFWELLLGLTPNPPDKTVAQRRTTIEAFFQKLTQSGSGADWIAAMGKLLGTNWTYREHDAEQGTVPQPPVLNLEAQYDPSDTTSITSSATLVSQINDKSGKGRHLTQSSGASKPITSTRTINSLNALDFTNQYLTGPNVTIAQPITVLMVVKDDDVSATQRTAFGGSVIPHPEIKQTNTPRWALYAGTDAPSTTAPTISPHILAAVFNGASSGLWLDGVQILTGNPSTAGYSGSAWRLGAQGTPGFFWDGLIGEVLVFSGDQSGHFPALNRYLGVKWGVTVPTFGNPLAYTISITIPSSAPLSFPINLTGTVSATLGTLPASTYYYAVTTVNTYGETTISAVINKTTTGSTSKVTLDWDDVAGATNYRIYRGPSAGALVELADVGGVASTFVDDGAHVPTTILPPATNTTRSPSAGEAEMLARSITPAHIDLQFNYSSGFIVGVSQIGEEPL